MPTKFKSQPGRPQQARPPKVDQVASAIRYSLVSPNESDSNYEPANVVDGLFAIARALHQVARELKAFRGNSTDGIVVRHYHYKKY
jgi:hypothetical protein